MLQRFCQVWDVLEAECVSWVWDDLNTRWLLHSMSELEHLRPGMYSGMKGGYDSFWKVPNWGNPWVLRAVSRNFWFVIVKHLCWNMRLDGYGSDSQRSIIAFSQIRWQWLELTRPSRGHPASGPRETAGAWTWMQPVAGPSRMSQERERRGERGREKGRVECRERGKSGEWAGLSMAVPVGLTEWAMAREAFRVTMSTERLASHSPRGRTDWVWAWKALAGLKSRSAHWVKAIVWLRLNEWIGWDICSRNWEIQCRGQWWRFCDIWYASILSALVASWSDVLEANGSLKYQYIRKTFK